MSSPSLSVKQDLIGLAAREAISYGVTASAVLRAIADRELRPEFERTIDQYLRTRSVNYDQASGLATELLSGPIGLLEVLTLGMSYVDHDLTVDRATEMLAWMRRCRQSVGASERTLQRARAVADELAVAEERLTEEVSHAS